MQHGDFTHIEIPADDADRAQRFYHGLFGWTFETRSQGFEGYYMFTTPVGEEGMGGAIGKRGEMAPDKCAPTSTSTRSTPRLPKITELGGTVVEEKREVAGQGWYAVFTDTEGNELAPPWRERALLAR